MEIILIIILAIILIKVWRAYTVRYDCVLAFTGGLGSGKTLNAVKQATKLLARNRRAWRNHNIKIWIKNFFIKIKNKKLLKKGKELKELKTYWDRKPMLYSNIPVRISKREYSLALTDKHLTLQERIRPGSITFIDEFSSIASQFDFKKANVVDLLDEFFRWYRHYVSYSSSCEGHIVVTDQSSANLLLQIRRRINSVFNLVQFRKYFNLIYKVKIRDMSISEDIVVVETGQKEDADNMRELWGFIGLPKWLGGFRKYDTHCYSERYITVPYEKERTYVRLKTNKVPKIPKEAIKPMTNGEDTKELTTIATEQQKEHKKKQKRGAKKPRI